VPQAVPPLSGCVLSAGYDRLTRPYSACSGVFGTLCATDCATNLKTHLQWVWCHRDRNKWFVAGTEGEGFSWMSEALIGMDIALREPGTIP